MLISLLLSSILGVSLPSPVEVPTLTAGESREVQVSGGEAWFRILEDDYVCLEVAVDGASEVFAYDDQGSLLCTDSGDGTLLLSAFSDYWFWIRAVPAGRGSGIVTADIEVAPSGRLDPGETVSSSVGLDEMAETYTFGADSPGMWTFDLDGAGETDLDLEVFGNRMSSWGSSMSLTGRERLSIPVLPGDSVVVVVSRFNKSGDGNYTLRAARTGRFPVLADGTGDHTIGFDTVGRFLVPGRSAPGFLCLSIGDPDADIDVTLHDLHGEYIMGAQSYSAVEALMLPASGDTLVADIFLFDAPSEDPVPYTLTLTPAENAPPGPPVRRTVTVNGTATAPIGFMSSSDGFVRVAVEFDKLRDGDVLVFRESGDPALSFSTTRGDEEFLLWAPADERIYVLPYFQTFGTSGDATVTVEPATPPSVAGSVRGEVGARTAAAFYTAAARAGTVLDVELSASDGETDLDLYVTGPGVDLVAEGWISNVDAAGNEAVTVYSPEDAEYGITVYMYDRTGSTPFDLSAETIQSPPLAGSSPAAETWALTVGISGYPDAADVLNRASMDAMDIYRFLTLDLGLPGDHVILLVDAMATVEAFQEGFNSLAEAAGPEDRILVFFSGHGFQNSPGSGGPEEEDSANETICLYDGDIDDDWLAEAVETRAEAPVVLMLDACHSGGFVNDFSRGSNALVLTAAREDLSVSERILTPILLKGAKGDADSDLDGYISAIELMEYIDARLQLICPECDAVLGHDTFSCPECGATLKGANAVPRPEQGMFLDDRGLELWPVAGGRGRGSGD